MTAWVFRSKSGVTMTLPDRGDLDWSLAEGHPQGEALWKYSLAYLPLILESSDDYRTVDHVISSLAQHMETDEWISASSWMTSLAHCMAMRIRALCIVACRYQRDRQAFPRAGLRILKQDIDRVTTDPSRFFTANNHGAMIAISLIHATQVFSGISSRIGDEAWKALKDIVDETFDDNGIPCENSPNYHAYWISLLEPFAEMSSVWPLRSSPYWFDLSDVVSAARSALTHFTDHTGAYVPIGDSHATPSLVTPSRESLLVSEHSGFVCYSYGDTLFTFNCGYTNYAHKHCDDTSITLAYRGVPLIVDAGYFGHDWRDPRVIYTKSQAAHSGLFLEDFDDLHPGKLIFPGREVLASSLTEEMGSLSFTGHVQATDGRWLRRRVSILDELNFEISDHIHSPEGAGNTGVQRFTFAPGAELTMTHGTIAVHHHGITLRLLYDDASLRDRPRLFMGADAPRIRGWTSPTPGVLVPTQCLELPILANSEVALSLVIDEPRGLEEL